MNKKQLLPKTALLVALSTLVGTSSYAFTAAQAKAVRSAVMSVPIPEMASKAVELTLQAEKQDREVTAVTAVRAIVFQHKSAAPSVVATVSKAVPEVAPAVAAAAADLSRTEAVSIAQAAIAAAPEQKQNITAAVSQSISPALAVAPVASPTTRLSVASTTSTEEVLTRGAGDVNGPSSGAVLTRGAGDASGPSSGTISSKTTAINPQTGGRGDGTFPSFEPAIPGPAQPVDYSQPRN